MNFLERTLAKFLLAFKSKTVWTVATFLAVQLPQIKNSLPPKWQGVIDVALAILAAYFRMNPSDTLNENIKVVNDLHSV